MRISDWSSDVCSSDLDPLVQRAAVAAQLLDQRLEHIHRIELRLVVEDHGTVVGEGGVQALVPGHVEPEPAGGVVLGSHRRTLAGRGRERSAAHTSELQSLMRTSYAAFCLKKKTRYNTYHHTK